MQKLHRTSALSDPVEVEVEAPALGSGGLLEGSPVVASAILLLVAALLGSLVVASAGVLPVVALLDMGSVGPRAVFPPARARSIIMPEKDKRRIESKAKEYI